VTSQQIKVLVTIEKGVDPHAVQESLPVYAGIHLVGLVDGLDEGWSTLQETPTDLLVIACAGYSERVLFLIEGAVKDNPQRPVVVLSNASSNGFVNRAFDAGAEDFLALPEAPDRVLFTLQKAMARKRGAAGAVAGTLSPLICVLGPKGGTGKTLTACNLAVALARAGNHVALADIDLQFGDVGLALGIAPESTIADLARAGGSIDAGKLESYMATHDSGLHVLLAPTRPDQASAIGVEFLRELYSTMRRIFDYVIVDTPPGFTPEVIASIDSSSHICMVGMLDSLSLKNTKLGLETLELMGYERERVTLVLNRADSKVGISREDVSTIVGRKPEVLVPSDRQIPISVNEGTPIVLVGERSEAARSFEQLARVYVNARQASGVGAVNGARSGARAGLSRLLGRKA
jgi:pilus assembly protein CpaE